MDSVASNPVSKMVATLSGDLCLCCVPVGLEDKKWVWRMKLGPHGWHGRCYFSKKEQGSGGRELPPTLELEALALNGEVCLPPDHLPSYVVPPLSYPKARWEQD